MTVEKFRKSVTRIKSAVEDYNLELATQELLALADEFLYFKKSFRIEASIIRGQYIGLKREVRYGESEETRRQRNKLAERILQHLDSCETGFLDNFDPQETSEEKTRNADAAITSMTSATAASILFKAENIEKSYDRFRLHPISLQLRQKEITAVVGENGSGKSTLLRIIAGVMKPDQTYWQDSENGNTSPEDTGYAAFSDELYYSFAKKDQWHEIKQGIGYMDQTIPGWTEKISITLSYTAAAHGFLGQENENTVNFFLSRLRLDEEMNDSWNYGDNWDELSGGLKPRFELVRLLIARPKLLVLDEPLAHLDQKLQPIFLSDLKELVKSDTYPLSIIISSQHLQEVESIADNIIFLKTGKVYFHGPADSVANALNGNVYEISCKMEGEKTIKKLENLHPKIRTEKNGVYWTLRCPSEFTADEILKILLGKKISIVYFRDITNSSIRFFHELG